MLGVIYSIPAEHPVHFTHLFWPRVKFDRTHGRELVLPEPGRTAMSAYGAAAVRSPLGISCLTVNTGYMAAIWHIPLPVRQQG